MDKKTLEKKLKVGAKIRLGKEYCESHNIPEQTGVIIELIQGYFEYDNGLYTEEQTAPSIWDDDSKEFESIYHLFGNDLDEFMDCEFVKEPKTKFK